MLMANETVAEECCRDDMPFVYRTHETPDPEKVESLLTLLHNQGVPVQKHGQEITPRKSRLFWRALRDFQMSHRSAALLFEP